MNDFIDGKMKDNNLPLHIIRDELVNIFELCQLVKLLKDKPELDIYLDLLADASYNTLRWCNTVQELHLYN